MSLSIRVSDQAKVDLLEIWCYIAEDILQAADQMIDKLMALYSLLLSMPEAGRSRSDLRPGIRSYPARPYQIFYQLSKDHIEILRILHGSRYLEDLFDDDNLETFRNI